ncbi:hypothetical protein MTR67_036188 [Solanum verrucosum]|uniref:Uncharacterized protein n=1 Tax=Solanum verrucosum TaxID=315347 RepID=A0AAF0UB86_SOLVR|nr:hypothetical protein MTR67_036188 [Solanum verrucosum]
MTKKNIVMENFRNSIADVCRTLTVTDRRCSIIGEFHSGSANDIFFVYGSTGELRARHLQTTPFPSPTRPKPPLSQSPQPHKPATKAPSSHPKPRPRPSLFNKLQQPSRCQIPSTSPFTFSSFYRYFGSKSVSSDEKMSSHQCELQAPRTTRHNQQNANLRSSGKQVILYVLFLL